MPIPRIDWPLTAAGTNDFRRDAVVKAMPRDGRERSEDARDRQRERADHVEDIVNTAEERFAEHKYPIRSDELAAEHADQPIDLPNETESVGSVFDRLDEEYDSPEEAREALYGELTGEAGGRNEYNEERAVEDLDDAERSDTA